MDIMKINISIWDTAETIQDKMNQIPTFKFGFVPTYRVDNIGVNYGERNTRLAGILTSVDILFIPTSGV
jgi:hypothetical protein